MGLNQIHWSHKVSHFSIADCFKPPIINKRSQSGRSQSDNLSIFSIIYRNVNFELKSNESFQITGLSTN